MMAHFAVQYPITQHLERRLHKPRSPQSCYIANKLKYVEARRSAYNTSTVTMSVFNSVLFETKY